MKLPGNLKLFPLILGLLVLVGIMSCGSPTGLNIQKQQACSDATLPGCGATPTPTPSPKVNPNPSPSPSPNPSLPTCTITPAVLSGTQSSTDFPFIITTSRSAVVRTFSASLPDIRSLDSSGLPTTGMSLGSSTTLHINILDVGSETLTMTIGLPGDSNPNDQTTCSNSPAVTVNTPPPITCTAQLSDPHPAVAGKITVGDQLTWTLTDSSQTITQWNGGANWGQMTSLPSTSISGSYYASGSNIVVGGNCSQGSLTGTIAAETIQVSQYTAPPAAPTCSINVASATSPSALPSDPNIVTSTQTHNFFNPNDIFLQLAVNGSAASISAPGATSVNGLYLFPMVQGGTLFGTITVQNSGGSNSCSVINPATQQNGMDYKTAFIQKVYATFTGRLAGQSEIDFWETKFSATSSATNWQAPVIWSIAGASDTTQGMAESYKNFGNQFGSGVASDAAWVLGLYHYILGKDLNMGDPSAAQQVDYWVSKIPTLQRWGVVQGFLCGSEYQGDLGSKLPGCP